MREGIALMDRRFLLFVEDDEIQRDSLLTAIRDWNIAYAGQGREFVVESRKDLASATEALDRMRFDCGLFDLRIPTGRTGLATDSGGNEIARAALMKKGFPVALITGEESVLDKSLLDLGQVCLFNKGDLDTGHGDPYERAVGWFAGQWDMMGILAAAHKKIEESAADIFIRRLWPRWSSFAGLDSVDPPSLIGIVTRQYVGHMADLLGIDGDEHATWHPFENYIQPALIEGRAHTGDLFRLNDGMWVVLTPQCDMATRKVKNIILCKCLPGIKDWVDHVAQLKTATSNTKRRDSEKFLTAFVNQSIGASQHFLAPLPGSIEPLIVDFTDLKSIALTELESDLGKRVAAISSPFISNLTQRFGAYVSRAGQPNIDIARFG